MDSDEVFDMIELIGSDPKRSFKVTVLKEIGENPLVKRVLCAAYDPLVTYGIATVEQPLRCSSGVFNDHTFELLNQLSDRALTGNAARQAVREELMRLSCSSSELLCRILTRDLRAGIDTKTINAAIPGLVTRMGYMRCSLPKQVDMASLNWEQGLYIQEKADGAFLNITRISDSVYFNTRKGTPLTESVEELSRDCLSLLPPDYQYHGELLVIHTSNGKVLDRKAGNGVLNSLLSGAQLDSWFKLRVLLWDMVELDEINSGKGLSGYASRFSRLVDLIGHSGNDSLQLIPNTIVGSMEEALEFYRSMLSLGKEGAILKTPAGLWLDGTSKHQIKLKEEKEADLVIVGFNSGKGKYKDTLGSLMCESSDGIVRVNVSGFTDAVRDEIWQNKESYIGKVVAIKFNSVINNKSGRTSLFLPEFVELRNDKHEANTLSEILSIGEQ
mgnify:CR=1 FL=1